MLTDNKLVTIKDKEKELKALETRLHNLLSNDTKIYFGHEYTLQNSNFCLANDSENLKLKDKIIKIKQRIKDGLPTIPTILNDEIECNIFLKAKNIESFSKLRDLKDNF